MVPSIGRVMTAPHGQPQPVSIGHCNFRWR